MLDLSTRAYALAIGFIAAAFAALQLAPPAASQTGEGWIVLLGDHFDLQMVVGAILALAGVFFIAVRSKQSKTALPLMIEREQS